jgi:hypothetical protein
MRGRGGDREKNFIDFLRAIAQGVYLENRVRGQELYHFGFWILDFGF